MDGRHERKPSSVLLVTSDHKLQDEVRRQAARVMVPVEVAPQPDDALSSWQEASVVLVGGDCAGSLARLRPTRRRCVSVVNAGIAHLEIFRNALDLGAVQVLELPISRDWLGDVLAESAVAELVDPERGAVLGILSATGGVGGSTLAAATATIGAERGSSVLVDLDPLGVGLERIVGYEGESVTRWATLGARALSPRALRDSLPRHGRVHLVGFGGGTPRLIEASSATSVISACSQAFDLTVLDIPRSLASATPEALQRCDLVAILCPQSVAATLAGQRLVTSLGRSHGVVLVTRAGPRHIAPGDVADALQAQLLIDVNDQRGLDEALAAGVGPLRSRGSGLQKAATAILDHLKVDA